MAFFPSSNFARRCRNPLHVPTIFSTVSWFAYLLMYVELKVMWRMEDFVYSHSIFILSFFLLSLSISLTLTCLSFHIISQHSQLIHSITSNIRSDHITFRISNRYSYNNDIQKKKVICSRLKTKFIMKLLRCSAVIVVAF